MTAATKRPKKSKDPRSSRKNGSNTHITFLIDRSGSMGNQVQGVINGYAEFVAEQQDVPGAATMHVVQFDLGGGPICDVLVDHTPLEELTGKELLDYAPRGSTPLYDATAQTIASVKEHIQSSEHSYDHIIFVVFTDGQENASREHSSESLTALTQQCEREGWTFVYLGSNANQHAQAHAQQSYSTTSSVGNVASASGTYGARAYKGLSSSLGAVRTGNRGIAGQTVQDFFVDESGKNVADEEEDETPI